MYILCNKRNKLYILGGVFLENKQFFDPYNFNTMSNQNCSMKQMEQDDNTFQPMMQMSPTMFYEQQYWYYNYLTKMLEYKIKMKEYENLNKGKN